jgi:hypothetical protein
MIFKNIFAKKFGEKLAFLTQNKAKLSKILVQRQYVSRQNVLRQNVLRQNV